MWFFHIFLSQVTMLGCTLSLFYCELSEMLKCALPMSHSTRTPLKLVCKQQIRGNGTKIHPSIRLIFERCLIWISHGTILTGFLRFSQSLQVNAGIVPRLGHGHFLPNSSFINHSTTWHYILSESELLYDWRFTASQFVLATGPLRLPASNFIFQLNACGYSPYVTSSLMRGRVCRL
jgi:hypothetical protein